jgi:hypothetical protein
MKKKIKGYVPDRCTPSAEEYRLFANQPPAVLRSYRLARISMAAALPVFAVLAVFHAGAACTLAAAGGTAAVFFLRKKYGLKGAAAPLICAIAGAALGVFLIAPLVTAVELIPEAYRGF